ncbi:MAG: imidazole glycerol phosphate synthase subunit HisH [Acidobacteria bacterium]|nr:imidazole glycerol phosphate synthase subunit HisH [Acidobacteriota bacterium]
MITVIDYGAGNLHSVENSLKYLNVSFQITSRAPHVASARAILLPGVGHFGQMMRSLQQFDIISPLRNAIRRGVPYLGICLGMHALYEGSEEAASYEGLGIFRGTIRRFPETLAHMFKIPHMGWNRLEITPRSRLFEGITNSPFVYFAHSYYLPADEGAADGSAAALCDYGNPFVAAVEQDRIFGVQFHPEKSGKIGLQVVANFVRFCGEAVAIEKAGGDRAG